MRWWPSSPRGYLAGRPEIREYFAPVCVIRGVPVKMMIKKLVACLFVVLGFIAPASPQDAPPVTSTTTLMSVTDFLLDWEQYKGKRITVVGCSFLMLGTAIIYCYDNAKKNPMTAVFGMMDAGALPREDRKVLLTSGCNPMVPRQNCVGDVNGVVSDLFGQPTLKFPSISWTTKPGS
jgi:hypothetical protein